MNVIAYALMGIDKKRAIQGKWRIKEATLFLFALLFGGVGATCGMVSFRHKTKHWYFKFGFPLLAVLSVVATILVFNVLAI
ncbi:MAG: DUF1294 domain-containing protein [Clostridia bacterium]